MSDRKELSLAVVEPAITPAEARQAIEKFATIEKALLDEDDFQEFTSRGEKRRFPKKSAFRKLALAFNLSDDILEERTEQIGDPPVRVWHFTVKAIAPNGRYSIGVGSFSADEREVAHEMHDPRAMAHTRAKNRAISDLIAGGMLSAEEMVGVEEYKAAPPKRTSAPPPSKPSASKPPEATKPTESTRESEIEALRERLHWKLVELAKADPSIGDKKQWLKEWYKVESSIELSLNQLKEAIQNVSAQLSLKVGPQATTEERKTLAKEIMDFFKSQGKSQAEASKKAQEMFADGKGGRTAQDLEAIEAKLAELKPKPEGAKTPEEQAEDLFKSLES